MIVVRRIRKLLYLSSANLSRVDLGGADLVLGATARRHVFVTKRFCSG